MARSRLAFCRILKAREHGLGQHIPNALDTLQRDIEQLNFRVRCNQDYVCRKRVAKLQEVSLEQSKFSLNFGRPNIFIRNFARLFTPTVGLQSSDNFVDTVLMRIFPAKHPIVHPNRSAKGQAHLAFGGPSDMSSNLKASPLQHDAASGHRQPIRFDERALGGHVPDTDWRGPSVPAKRRDYEQMGPGGMPIFRRFKRCRVRIFHGPAVSR
jgi:hypothetical protein